MLRLQNVMGERSFVGCKEMEKDREWMLLEGAPSFSGCWALLR
jgi:hypothetical protein